MNTLELKNTILAGGIDATLTDGLMVSPAAIPMQRERYASAVCEFEKLYGDGEVSI